MSTGHSGSLGMVPVCLEVTRGHWECVCMSKGHSGSLGMVPVCQQVTYILILVQRRVIVSLSCTKVITV